MSGADRAAVRRAETRTAAAVGAAVLVVVALTAAIAWVAGRAEGLEGAATLGGEVPVEQVSDDKALLLLAVVVVVGTLSAGAVGLLAARRAVRPVQEALATQRRFVADASHELRTPLTVVHTRAQLLLARTAPDDPRRPVTAQLVEDTRVLGEVVTDLLVSAQLEGQGGALAREPVDVLPLLHAVADSFEAIAHGVHLEVSGAPVSVPAAPTALRRAVACLVDNALAHSPAGGGVVVGAEHDAARGLVRISVADEGEGFPASAEDRRRLTARFEQGARSDSSRPRFGLGLALVREVAERHGGRLVLGDRDGGGALATIELPDR
ncbi:sensor histidine kinase [Cellulomonas soli]|uniref:sensor histidine kinase n=1 Tax=Cellulomonas soli TaxID=931535 RepID=UPI003F8448C6